MLFPPKTLEIIFMFVLLDHAPLGITQAYFLRKLLDFLFACMIFDCEAT